MAEETSRYAEAAADQQADPNNDFIVETPSLQFPLAGETGHTILITFVEETKVRGLKATEKVVKAISLPMTPGLSNSFSANWSGAEVGFASNFALNAVKKFMADTEGASANGLDAIKAAGKAAFESIKQIGGDIPAKGGAIALGLNALSDTNFANTVKTRYGINTKQFDAQRYDGTTFRNFQFSWKLIAKSFAETETIRQIEQAFKKAMHARVEETLLVRFPTKMKIQFLVGVAEESSPGNFDTVQRENTYLPKLKKCVCTGANFIYNSSGNNFFKESLAPVEVDVSLSFVETEYLFSDDFGGDSTSNANGGYYR